MKVTRKGNVRKPLQRSRPEPIQHMQTDAVKEIKRNIFISSTTSVPVSTQNITEKENPLQGAWVAIRV